MRRRFLCFASVFCIILISSAESSFADTKLFKFHDSSASFRKTDKAGDKLAGHKNTVNNLKASSSASQAGFLAAIESMRSAGDSVSYRAFWIADVVLVSAPQDVLRKLSARVDIDAVYDDYPVSLIEPVETGDAVAVSTGHERGLEDIGATDVWRMGLDGSGSLVCNFDTGVNGNHPALAARYRGNNGGEHSACWFDPYSGTEYPIDQNGHGTHTMGTMVGAESGDTVGVAPGAQWIAAAVVDRGGGIQRTISDILAAFEWAADPDGDPSTTDDVPDVINNSWGIPLGYYPSCNETFWEAIDNLEAAGVVCLFAAGNEGPYPSTIRTPADRITTDFNCFSVGAVNGNLADFPVASFSSRGPSGCDGVTIKPEVTAPGVSIRSAGRTGGYVTMSGTSMATPHAAGAVAILRQFNPHAIPSQIKQALMLSARDLGVAGEDNDYGWGMIDIKRALYYMPPPAGVFPVILDTDISGDGVADPGEQFDLEITVENLGSPAGDVSAHLSSVDSRVTVISSDVHITFIDHADTVVTGPFEIIFGADIPTGERISFTLRMSSAEGSRDAGFYICAGGSIEPGVATHDNGRVRFSVSNIGQFGLGPGSINPMGGSGFEFPSGGPDYLWNASLVLATDPIHVSDGTMTMDPTITDDDFAPAAGGYPRIIEPGVYSDQDGLAAYTDSAAENPLGANITQRSFCWTGQSAAPLVIAEFTIENISGSILDPLYIGIFCDWDLPLSSGNDDIVGYVDYQSLGYMTDISSNTSVGVRSITSYPSSYSAIDNTASIDDGFSESEKFQFMTCGFENISNSIPGNYSTLLTVGPFSLAPGESEVAAFAFLAGSDLDELISNAELSFDLYPGFTDIGSGQPAPRNLALLTNYPNPFNGNTIIELAGTTMPGSRIEIYDVAGRLVSDLTLGGSGKVVWGGRDRHGDQVAAGIYFAKLSGGPDSNVRKIIYLK